MSYTSITEYDAWPRVKNWIVKERELRVTGLLNIQTIEQLHRQQSYIQALDDVMQAARPKPTEEDDN